MKYTGSEATMQAMIEIGAIKEGHFQLSSGRHSANYVQCARLFEYPEKASKACAELARKVSELAINVVAGPALGGVIISYEMARQLGVRNVFGERQNGEMCLRRGFELSSEDRVLIVEDVVTTGGSATELINVIKKTGATPIAVASVINRSPDGTNPFDIPFFYLLEMAFPSWEQKDCPLCLAGGTAIKPGSRPQ